MNRRRIALAVATLTTATLLTGCGTPPWEQDLDTIAESLGTRAGDVDTPERRPAAGTDAGLGAEITRGEREAVEPVAAARPAAEPAPAPEPATGIVARPNDLGAGSTQRTLTAGNVEVTANYWTPLSMDQWHPGASKPVSVSLTGAEPEGRDVYLSRTSVATTVTDAGGTVLASPTVYEDRSALDPGYLMSDPYSYATTVILPPLDPTAVELTVTFSYDLLVPVSARSGDYVRHTAVDTLHIALTTPAGPGDQPAVGQVSAHG